MVGKGLIAALDFSSKGVGRRGDGVIGTVGRGLAQRKVDWSRIKEIIVCKMDKH